MKRFWAFLFHSYSFTISSANVISLKFVTVALTEHGVSWIHSVP